MTSRTKLLLPLGAMLAFAACSATAPADHAGMYPLVDSTGTVLGYATASSLQGVPPGTALRMPINGRDQTVTVGPRVSPGTSAGQAVIIGMDNGRPIIGHVGEGVGSLSPGGTPVVTGTRGADNRPNIVYQQAGQPTPVVSARQ